MSEPTLRRISVAAHSDLHEDGRCGYGAYGIKINEVLRLGRGHYSIDLAQLFSVLEMDVAVTSLTRSTHPHFSLAQSAGAAYAIPSDSDLRCRACLDGVFNRIEVHLSDVNEDLQDEDFYVTLTTKRELAALRVDGSETAQRLYADYPPEIRMSISAGVVRPLLGPVDPNENPYAQHFRFLGLAGPANQPAAPEEKNYEVVPEVRCACGGHILDPNEDPYAQHRAWEAEKFKDLARIPPAVVIPEKLPRPGDLVLVDIQHPDEVGPDAGGAWEYMRRAEE